MTTVYDFSAKTLAGQDKALADFRGQALLIVNVASQCGLTPHYAGLEELYRGFKDRGLIVLGFPCHQFGNQEPGTEHEIRTFCETRYGVTFPMFAKVDVNGDDTHPLFEWLKSERGGLLGSAIKWNFTKFLVGRDGDVIKRYGSTTKPEALSSDIEAALAAEG